MAIDVLQMKMKKVGNPLVLNLAVYPDDIPNSLKEQNQDPFVAYVAFCRSILQGLKGEIAAVRFSMMHFSLLGLQGPQILSDLLKYAVSLGFYTILDIPGVYTSEEADFAANAVWGEPEIFCSDAILISGYSGSDVIKPFVAYCEEKKKDLFVIVRTPNKSASELQDLLAGSRMVHMASTDYVNRFSASTVGKYGYSRIGVQISATAPDSIRMIRAKYRFLFLLIDGMDYSGANAKNCSLGFDNLGHGAAVCVSSSIIRAWREKETDNYVDSAIDAVRKAVNRISRYITIY